MGTGLNNQSIPAAGVVNFPDPIQVYSIPLSADQLVQESFAEYMLHIGRVYSFSRYVTIPGNASSYMAFETGDVLAHLWAEYRNSQDIKWEALTGFSYNADGTVITPLNQRFDVRGNPLYTVAARARHSMTGIVDGSVAVERYIPSGGKGIGSSVDWFGSHWIFDKNTQYLFKYTNLTNQDCIFNLIVEFYELNLS